MSSSDQAADAAVVKIALQTANERRTISPVVENSTSFLSEFSLGIFGFLRSGNIVPLGSGEECMLKQFLNMQDLENSIELFGELSIILMYWNRVAVGPPCAA